MWPVATINHLFGLGTLLMHAAIVALCAIYIVRARYVWCGAIAKFVHRYAMLAAMYFAFMTVAASLFYSEVLGFAPCGLCWLQRVFLYPQAVLFAVAVWKRDERRIADYSIALSVLGGIIALYHTYIQAGGNVLLPCPAVSLAADCARRTFFEFGYVTFPLIGLTSCIFLIVLMVYVRMGDENGK